MTMQELAWRVRAVQLELKYFDQVSRKGFGAIEAADAVAIELCINLLLPDEMLIALLICLLLLLLFLLLLLLLLVVGYFVVASCPPAGSCHMKRCAWAWHVCMHVGEGVYRKLSF